MGPGLRRDDKRAKNLLASPARLAKQRLPGVLAVAGRSVLAFRKPDSLGGHSFQDIRMDCLKGEETLSLWRNTGRGRRLCWMPRSCPRLQAPAGRCYSLQRLNPMACTDG